MNNEPVAWMQTFTQVKDNIELVKHAVNIEQVGINDIPLYIHSVKEQGNPVAWRSQSPDGYWSLYGAPVEGAEPLYTGFKELTDKEIIESLAELEHEQWMKWADTIMQTEKISDSRFARWASCMIPYAELSEEMKEHDRVWARQALAILRKANKK